MIETTPETGSPSMLLSFTGSNVRSFRDSFTISMLATRMSEPAIARPIPWREGGQPLDVLPVALVLGSNASGKSNLLRAMADLRALVLHSFRSGDPSGGVPRRRFLLDEESAKWPTSFEIDLVLHGVRHVYSITLDDDRIVTERAVRFPKGKESLLFHRDKDKVEFGAVD
jgi:uncharacterized protein